MRLGEPVNLKGIFISNHRLRRRPNVISKEKFLRCESNFEGISLRLKSLSFAVGCSSTTCCSVLANEERTSHMTLETLYLGSVSK